MSTENKDINKDINKDLDKDLDKDTIKVINILLIFICVLLAIAIKIWTFILLINYYNILNDNIKLDDTIVYNDYKYIYYLAIANIIFTLITILYSLIILILFFMKSSIFTNYNKVIEISITIMWIISIILSITSYIISNKIKEKYNKYLSVKCNEYDKYIYFLSSLSLIFFCLSLIIEYIIPYSIKIYRKNNIK
jgi:hypothetical protein